MYQTFWWKALVGMAKGVWRVATFAPGAGGGGTWVNVCRVCAAGLSEPLSYYSLYRPHLSHFLENVFFCDPNFVTFHLCIYLINEVSSGGMSPGLGELIVKFNKQQLSDFLTENLPILNPYLPPTSENLRPHSSKSIGNATPL